MAKYDNPVRGYVACPVCQSAASVHQCGEGQLIATGEPPKNSRNLGLLYYRCPECGNSSISKRGSEFVSANMVAEVTGLKPLQAAPVLADEPETLTVTEALNLTGQTEPLTVTDSATEVSETEALSTEVTETPTVKWWANRTVKRVLAIVALLIFILWTVRQLMPKSAKQGGEHVAA